MQRTNPTFDISGFLTGAEEKEALSRNHIPLDYLNELDYLCQAYSAAPNDKPNWRDNYKDIYKNFLSLVKHDQEKPAAFDKRRALAKWSGVFLLAEYRDQAKRKAISPTTDIASSIHFFATIHHHLADCLNFSDQELDEISRSDFASEASASQASAYLLIKIGYFVSAHKLLAALFLQFTDLKKLNRCVEIHLFSLNKLKEKMAALKENRFDEARSDLDRFEEDAKAWQSAIIEKSTLMVIPSLSRKPSTLLTVRSRLLDEINKIYTQQDNVPVLVNEASATDQSAKPPAAPFYHHQIHGFLTPEERNFDKKIDINDLVCMEAIFESFLYPQVENAFGYKPISVETAKGMYQRILNYQPNDTIEKRALLQKWGALFLIAEYGALLNKTLTISHSLQLLNESAIAMAKTDIRRSTHFLVVLCDYVDVSLDFSRPDFFALLSTNEDDFDELALVGYLIEKKKNLILGQHILAIIFEQSQDVLVLRRCMDAYSASLNRFKKTILELTSIGLNYSNLMITELEEATQALQVTLATKSQSHISKKKLRREKAAKGSHLVIKVLSSKDSPATSIPNAAPSLPDEALLKQSTSNMSRISHVSHTLFKTKQKHAQAVLRAKERYNIGHLIQLAKENPEMQLHTEALKEIQHNLLEAKQFCLQEITMTDSNKYRARLGWLEHWEKICDEMLQKQQCQSKTLAAQVVSPRKFKP